MASSTPVSGLKPPWEHGSELHFDAADLIGSNQRALGAWERQGAQGRLYGSGRDALRDLLRHGKTQLGWQRLLIPSYFCQDVAVSLTRELPTDFYIDRPGLRSDERSIAARAGDAVLNVNLFGFRTANWAFSEPGVAVIEDHTHDPWSEWAWTSQADFAVASLRKTLPLPDGAVLWSPTGRPLPGPIARTPERQIASERKLAGLLLKSLYLRGAAVDKQTFRDLTISGEALIGEGEPSGMPPATISLLRNLPAPAWRRARAANFSQVSECELGPAVRLLRPDGDAVPFGLLFAAATTELRERLNSELVQRNVYGARLWPMHEPSLPNLPEEDLSLSQRSLFLHCDYRYDAAHMTRLIATLKSAMQACGV